MPKTDVYGISRAVRPWNSADSVDEERLKGKPLFHRMEAVACKEYPVCAGCQLPEFYSWHPLCKMRKGRKKRG